MVMVEGVGIKTTLAELAVFYSGGTERAEQSKSSILGRVNSAG